MEHRHELEDLLLAGLPEPERAHVVRTMNAVTAQKLAHKRSQLEHPAEMASSDD